MGVIPLQFLDESPNSTAPNLHHFGRRRAHAAQGDRVKVTKADGMSSTFAVRVRIDTANELEYFQHGGILHYVLRNLARGAAA